MRPLVRKPSLAALAEFIAHQSRLSFTYEAVGATAAAPPAEFVVDRSRIELGAGRATFQAAQTALRAWRQFQLGWVEPWSPETPLEPGRVVAVLGRVGGFWWLNACRIVYVVDDLAESVGSAESQSSEKATRFGFAYGTLPGHAECGEERFLLEWDRKTDRVAFDILAFSRPNSWLARLGAPLVRRCQKQFGREAAEAMFRAVDARSPLPVVWQSSS